MDPAPAYPPISLPIYPPDLLQALADGTPSGAQLLAARELGLVKITDKNWWLSVYGDAVLAARHGEDTQTPA